MFEYVIYNHKGNKHAMPLPAISMQIYLLVHCTFKVIEKALVGLENYLYCTIKFLIFTILWQ